MNFFLIHLYLLRKNNITFPSHAAGPRTYRFTKNSINSSINASKRNGDRIRNNSSHIYVHLPCKKDVILFIFPYSMNIHIFNKETAPNLQKRFVNYEASSFFLKNRIASHKRIPIPPIEINSAGNVASWKALFVKYTPV